EQKWIVACVFMPPLYSLTAYVSLHEPHWRLLLLLVRECYESAAIYSFAMFLISCLGGQERTIWKLSRSTYQPFPRSANPPRKRRAHPIPPNQNSSHTAVSAPPANPLPPAHTTQQAIFTPSIFSAWQQTTFSASSRSAGPSVTRQARPKRFFQECILEEPLLEADAEADEPSSLSSPTTDRQPESLTGESFTVQHWLRDAEIKGVYSQEEGHDDGKWSRFLRGMAGSGRWVRRREEERRGAGGQQWEGVLEQGAEYGGDVGGGSGDGSSGASSGGSGGSSTDNVAGGSRGRGGADGWVRASSSGSTAAASSAAATTGPFRMPVPSHSERIFSRQKTDAVSARHQKPLPFHTAPPSHSASESTWPRGGAAGGTVRQQPPQYTDSESCAREDEGYWSSTDADVESGGGEGVVAGCWESVRQESIMGDSGSSGFGWRGGAPAFAAAAASGGDGEGAGGESRGRGRGGGGGGGGGVTASTAAAPSAPPGAGGAAAGVSSSAAAVYVHPVPLRWLLPEWVHGQQLFQECKFGIVLYMVIKPACALLQVVFGPFGLYKEGDFSPYSLYPYATLLINLSQMYALYCIVVFYHAIGHYLAHIRPLGKFLAIKGVIFVTYWQSVIIAAAVLFLGLGSGGASPLHGLDWQDVVQDWLICVEMAAAVLANHWTFPVSPYTRSRLAPARMQRLPAGVVAVLADMADPSAPLDPEEILASEVIGRSLFKGSVAAAGAAVVDSETAAATVASGGLGNAGAGGFRVAGMGGEGALGGGRIGDGRDRRGGGMGAGGDVDGRGGSGVEVEWNAGGSGGLAGALAAASRVVGAPFRRDRREDAWEYASDYLGRRDMEVSEKIHDVLVGGGTDAFQDMQAAVQRGMQPISAAVEPLTAAVQPFSAAVTSAHQQVASTWHQLQASLPALPAAFLPAVADSRGNVRDGGAGERSRRVGGRGNGDGGCGADGKRWSEDDMGIVFRGRVGEGGAVVGIEAQTIAGNGGRRALGGRMMRNDGGWAKARHGGGGKHGPTGGGGHETSRICALDANSTVLRVGGGCDRRTVGPVRRSRSNESVAGEALYSLS
ncbi:unnamed protein product, partial [Closterium sp. NIES-53]